MHAGGGVKACAHRVHVRGCSAPDASQRQTGDARVRERGVPGDAVVTQNDDGQSRCRRERYAGEGETGSEALAV